MSDYPYETLNYRQREIRTVLLLPVPLSSPIRCRLETHDLYELSFHWYEALSYEWGESTGEERSIFLNDRKIQIRQNLWLALIHLRYSDSPRLLWIDALCIDQANPQERNHQVRIMGDIYSRAKLVLVWLGLEGENSAEMFAYFNWIRINDVFGPLYKSDYYYIPESLVGDQVVWEGLASLLKRRYWTRIWIVQEFNLGKELEIHCGWDCIGSETFMDIIQWIWCGRMAASFSPIFERIRATPGMKIATRRDLGTERYPCSLYQLLLSCKDSQCSDPRDKIYALIPLAASEEDVPEDEIQFPIDYSLSLFELKLRVALHYFVKENQNLEFILRLMSRIRSDSMFIG